MEVAEKLPNIEMLLSKIMQACILRSLFARGLSCAIPTTDIACVGGFQGTERLTPIMNLVQKSWVLASQLEGAHAKHDRSVLLQSS